MKLVTVVIPVYNVQQYIEECVSSVLNQTLGSDKIEILIIDDCSPDNSIELVKMKFGFNKSIRIIHHETNKGLGGARNTGIMNCKTPYLFFLDSDDVIYEDALETLLNNIEQNNSDISVGGVDNYSDQLHFDSSYLKFDNKTIDNFNHEFTKGKLPILNVVVWNKLYRTSLIENERFLERTYFEDEPFTLSICTKAKTVSFVDKQVYKYRRRNGSITGVNINEKHIESIFSIYKRSLTILNEFAPELMGEWLVEKVDVVFNRFKLDEKNKVNLFKTIEDVLQNFKFDTLIEYNILNHLESHLYKYEIYLSKNGLFSNYLNDFKWKVGIIIPTYKRSENILHAINSVLNQTYGKTEVIVVDDNGKGSVEQLATQKKLQHLISDGRIKYIEHSKNTNGATARNTGIKAANCEFISFLDDDDEYLRTKIARSVDSIKKYNTTYGGVYCGYLGWNSDELDLSRFKEGDLTYELLTLDYKAHYLHTNTVLYRKSALLSINGFDESFKRHQDLEMNLRFFEKNKVGVVKEALVKIRPNPTKTENWLKVRDFYKLKLKFLNKFKYLIETFDVHKQLRVYEANWFEIANRFESFEHFVEFGSSIDGRNDLYLILVLKNKLAKLSEQEDLQDYCPEPNEKNHENEKNEYSTELLHDLMKQKEWYENTYESLPLWWKKIGSLIRKIKSN